MSLLTFSTRPTKLHMLIVRIQVQKYPKAFHLHVEQRIHEKRLPQPTFDRETKSIGYIQSSIRTGNFIGRENGFKEALHYNDIPYDTAFCYHLAPGITGAYEDMKAYIKKSVIFPDSLLAENDVLAIGAMRALLEYGYKIPQDIQICGIDNVAISQITTTTLSTMNISKSSIGQTAFNTLLLQIELRTIGMLQVKIGGSFIQRESTRQTTSTDTL